MELKKCFSKLLNDYSQIYSEVWKNEKFKHPFGKFIREDIPKSIFDLQILESDRHTIKASCGVGRWTPVPWIAIFDTNITKRARDGVYIVYLLNKDTKTLYLTLNQATYQQKLDVLRENALKIRDVLGNDDLKNNIISGSKEYDAACVYSIAYTIDTLPDDEVLKNDLKRFIDIYDNYYNKVFLTQLENNWWPSLDEYNPGISKELWLDLLNDGKTFTQNAYEALAAYYAFGGEGTCSQIADEYGHTSDFYRMSLGVQLAEKVHKATNCPKLNSDESKLWPIIFVGRNANSDEHGNYVWKIRPELMAALSEFDIKRFLTPENPAIWKLSHGGGIFTHYENTEFLNNNIVLVHENTGPIGRSKITQGENFISIAKSGDYFYLCYGNTGIALIGQFISDAAFPYPKKGEGWYAREYKIVKKSVKPDVKYNGITKAWTPNQNSTFVEIKDYDYYEFEKSILTPYFDMKLSELGISIEEGEIELDTTKQKLDQIKAYIAAEGFTYPDGLVENFYLSLKSKPFVILAGTSGTGKTRLVKLFAEAVGATKDNGRYQLVAVRPDWSDSSDLFGHVDLNGNFVKGAIIDFVKKAELDKSKPYFLCLDEMNLARVEYYLSDFLSIIETRDFNGNEIVTDPILESNYFSKDSAAAGRYGTIRLPENLYIIGTVNMDETTFPFSKKVLDRANTIEFSYVDLIPNFEESFSEVNPLNLDNEFLKTKYLRLMQCVGEKKVQSICVELDKINKILEKANAHIGYRVRDEIVFYMLSNDELLNDDDAFDNEIMQKILPRIQGSSVSIKAMLCDLFKVCAGDYDGYQTEDNISGKMLKAAEKPGCKYKKSAKKIAFMVRRFEEDGFTSYWL